MSLLTNFKVTRNEKLTSDTAKNVTWGYTGTYDSN